MVVLGVVGRVAQDCVEGQVGTRLAHRRREVRRVVAGPATDDGTCDQVGTGVADRGQLGPERLPKGGLSPPPLEVAADMPCLQARGVDGALRTPLDQAERTRADENGGKKAFKRPPFSNRCSA